MRFQDVGTDISPTLKSGIEERDTAISLRWAGDPRKALATLAVCAALVKEFEAVVHDPDKDKLLSFDQLLARAQDTQASL